MKKFGEIFQEYLQGLTKTKLESLQNNTEIYLRSNWKNLSENIQDSHLKEILIETQFVSFIDTELTIKITNSNVRFLFEMNQNNIMAVINKSINIALKSSPRIKLIEHFRILYS